jgi:hypothetical protein
MKKRMFFALAALLLPAAPAAAHVRLIYPVPRDRIAHKSPPCGGVPRGNQPLVLTAGEEIEVVWEEFIDHPGHYSVSFSAGGDRDFITLLDNIPDGPIPAGSATLIYSATVRLPSEPCEAGTLQVIQVMTENPRFPQLYYSCADVRLVAPVTPVEFRRGDANADGQVNITDGVRTFNYLFLGGADITCLDAADSNDDGALNLTDGVNTLNWLFRGGAELPPPGPQVCGPDASDDPVPCAAYEACAPPPG